MHPFRPSVYFTLLILPLAFLSIACDGDYRKSATGPLGDLPILVDTTGINMLDSLTMEQAIERIDSNLPKVHYALREVFEHGMYASPGFERAYDTRYVSFEFKDDLEKLKRSRNLAIVASLEDQSPAGQFLNALLDESVKQAVREGRINYIALKEKWYKDQLTLLITAPTNEELAEFMMNNPWKLVQDLEEVERDRYTYEVYKKKEQTDISDSLWVKHGFKIRVQHDYVWNVDTTDFVSMRRYMPENDRWFWVHWVDGVRDTSMIDQLWINSRRDALLKEYIRGTVDSSYVQTEYERPIKIEQEEVNGYAAWSVEGTWKMVNSAMGGGFVHMSYYVPEQQRVYMVEYMVFAPNFRKRPFIRQFQAMVRTFEHNPNYPIQTDR